MKRLTVVSLVLLFTALPALAQKKGGVGGGGLQPSAPPDPAIAYRDGGIRVANGDGSNNVEVVPLFFTPSWGPSGAGTAQNPHRFVCTDGSETQLVTYRVWTDGSAVRSEIDQVLFVAPEQDWVAIPSWSGQRIAFKYQQEWRTRLHPPTIQLLDLATGVQTQVYEAAAGMAITRISWFSDGERMAFSEEELGNRANSRIAVLDTRDGSLTEVLPAGTLAGISGVAMARTEDHVAFSARMSANVNDWKVYVFTLDLTEAGAQPIRRVQGAYPAWSPDDTKLLFRDTRDTLSALTLATGKSTPIAAGGITPDWRR